jgi:hypothetical protein
MENHPRRSLSIRAENPLEILPPAYELISAGDWYLASGVEEGFLLGLAGILDRALVSIRREQSTTRRSYEKSREVPVPATPSR